MTRQAMKTNPGLPERRRSMYEKTPEGIRYVSPRPPSILHLPNEVQGNKMVGPQASSRNRGAAAASIEALTAPSVPLRREPNCGLQTGSSKPFCATGIGLGAIVSSPETNPNVSASAITDCNGPRRPGCIKASTSGKEAIEDAKNAGTAKEDTDLTPKPPHRTGRESWAHALSERQQLEIFDKEDLNASSKTVISGLRKHGDDLST